MIRLLWAGATRLVSRRFTSLALLVLLLGLGAYQLVINDSLSPPTAEQLATAQQTYEEAHKDWIDNHEKYEQDCRDTGDAAEDCTFPEPTLADFGVDPTPFKEVARTALILSTMLVAVTAFLISACFMGAEYSSGSIANWLTFIPRRGQVFWSKLLTLVGFAAALGTFGAALTLAGALVVARLYGSRVESLRQLAELGVRSLLAVIGLTVLGFCIALVTRHTAGAIGVLLGYSVLFFLRMGILRERAWVQHLTPWTPEWNLAAVVADGYEYSVPVEKVTPGGAYIQFVQHTVSLTHGAIYWGVLLAVVIAGSQLIFRRRDVL
jgi:ABC-2 type transport system permease protein